MDSTASIPSILNGPVCAFRLYNVLAYSRSRAIVGVTLSTSQNPQSFDDFQLVNTFSQLQGEGGFCLPLDFSTSNVTLTAGQNVTIEVSRDSRHSGFAYLAQSVLIPCQIVFSGGDGQLYQVKAL